jgi:hypothetical protein
MTCIRILKSAVIPVYNSKHERIEGSRIFKVYLGSLYWKGSIELIYKSKPFQHREHAVESREDPVAHVPVSHPRSSNGVCSSPPHGFPTDFTSRHTMGGCIHRPWQRHTKFAKYLL